MTSAPTRQQTWLSQPHHDGSGRYVSHQTPRLGDRVDVLVRVPLEAEVAAVHVRTAPDGEATFTVARKVRTTAADAWWRATLTCHNPVTNYRFLLTGGPTKYVWLNGTGVHERDVPDASDFRLVAHASPPPEWALGSVVYQIFPDRFAASRRAGWQDRDEHGRPLRRTMGIASLGGATLDNEENYLIKKLFTALGALQIENQARI